VVATTTKDGQIRFRRFKLARVEKSRTNTGKMSGCSVVRLCDRMRFPGATPPAMGCTLPSSIRTAISSGSRSFKGRHCDVMENIEGAYSQTLSGNVSICVLKVAARSGGLRPS
jgi:hypothetical protein